MSLPAEVKINHLLDATGLICPMPVLKAKKMLQSMHQGEVLRVIATDNAALKDFPAFCELAKYKLLQVTQEEGRAVFDIQKP